MSKCWWLLRQKKTSWCLNSVIYCEVVYCSWLFVRSKLCLPQQRKTRSLCHCFVISGFSRKTNFANKQKLIYGEKREVNIFENCTCQKVNKAKNFGDKQRSPCRARHCDLLVANATKNWGLATKFSELVASWRLAFCPMTKENHDTTFVFKSLY